MLHKTIKKILFFIGLPFLILVGADTIWWWVLPVSINRYWDIRFGNDLIEKIDEYKKSNPLPGEDDYEILKKLGFKEHYDYFIPDYVKLDDKNYQLTYIKRIRWTMVVLEFKRSKMEN